MLFTKKIPHSTGEIRVGFCVCVCLFLPGEEMMDKGQSLVKKDLNGCRLEYVVAPVVE